MKNLSNVVIKYGCGKELEMAKQCPYCGGLGYQAVEPGSSLTFPCDCATAVAEDDEDVNYDDDEDEGEKGFETWPS